MGRPKKNRSQILVSLVADFYEREANGDCSRLRFTALSDYAKSRGYEAEAYDFRRDAAVRGKIEEIKTRQEEQAEQQHLTFGHDKKPLIERQIFHRNEF